MGAAKRALNADCSQQAASGRRAVAATSIKLARCADGTACTRHGRRRSRFQVSGSGRRCADVSRVHSTKRSTAYMLTRRRDEAALRLESCAHIARGCAVTIRIRRVRSARTAGFIPIRDRCQPAGAWSRPLLCAVRLAPVRSMDWRGRVRRIGATLPAAKTHARSQGMPA
jgi:hypothetical protein